MHRINNNGIQLGGVRGMAFLGTVQGNDPEPGWGNGPGQECTGHLLGQPTLA